MFREDVLEIISAAVKGLRQAWRHLFVADLLFKLLTDVGLRNFVAVNLFP